MIPRSILRWIFDEPVEPFPPTRFEDRRPGLLARAALAVWNMSQPTAAALCILIAIIFTLAVGSL